MILMIKKLKELNPYAKFAEFEILFENSDKFFDFV